MAFKQITKAREYRAWKEWDEEDFLIGEFVDHGTKDSQFGPQQWFDIKVRESNFGAAVGKMLRLNGCGTINATMEMVDRGSIVKFTYNGVGKIPKGKFKNKDFYDITIEVDGEEMEQSEDDYNDL